MRISGWLCAGVVLGLACLLGFAAESSCAFLFWPARIDYAATGGPNSVDGADLDGDADVDLVATQYTWDNVAVYLNNGDGSFAPGIPCGTGSGPYGLFVADLDSDGDSDVAVANLGGGRKRVHSAQQWRRYIRHLGGVQCWKLPMFCLWSGP